MTIELILVTHGTIGESLINTIQDTFETLPISTTLLPIFKDCDIEIRMQELDTLIQTKKQHDILILTDLYGATPCNLAQQYHTNPNISVVTGVNLSMLMRVMNYPQLPLVELTQKALSGGHDGIKEC